jgi:phosphatidate cytidylyltransferase
MGEPATAPEAQSGRSSNLVTRVISALVLVPIAIGAGYGGGAFWLALTCLGAIGLFWEWQYLVGGAQTSVLGTGVFGLVMIGAALDLHDLGAAVFVIPAGALAIGSFTVVEARFWAPGGIAYAGSALIASVLIRQDVELGLEALMFVLVTVWITDILGYFGGRGIGGPKLWTRVSPNKTWAGAIAGALGSTVFAAAFAVFDNKEMWPVTALGLALSIIAQLGDLGESALKRRFGAKHSGNLVPGHGGVLDRLDGFVAAAIAAALIGAMRSGTDAVGHGLLIW